MWMAKLREIDDNFCWNIYTSIEKVNKMWWALRIFFFFFFMLKHTMVSIYMAGVGWEDKRL